ncbi:5554_t:CDS:2, partial [Ambispora gerdemannii]
RQTNFSNNTKSPTLLTLLRNDVNNIMTKFQQLDSKLDKILNTLITQIPSSKTSTHTQFDDTTVSHNHNDNINDMFMQNDELIDNTINTPHKTLHFDKLIN